MWFFVIKLISFFCTSLLLVGVLLQFCWFALVILLCVLRFFQCLSLDIEIHMRWTHYFQHCACRFFRKSCESLGLFGLWIIRDIFTVALFVMWCMWDKKVIGKIKRCVGNCNDNVSKYILTNKPQSKQTYYMFFGNFLKD